MVKCTGMEEQTPEKVLLLYKAVYSLIHEGVDITSCKVEEITRKAGIGKGTAYDYFDTREDIIVAALCYSMKHIYLWLCEELAKTDGFFGKLEALLQLIDGKMPETDCFLRFVHMLTDTTICGKKLQACAQHSGEQGLSYENLLKNMIQEGIAKKELSDSCPMDYMAYEIGAKIIAYIIYIKQPGKRAMTADEMKKHLLDGVRNEFRVE